METAVAPETFQLSVELPPAVMLAGLAVKELITGREGGGGAAGGEGGGAAATVTLAVLVTLPAALLAVRV